MLIAHPAYTFYCNDTVSYIAVIQHTLSSDSSPPTPSPSQVQRYRAALPPCRSHPGRIVLPGRPKMPVLVGCTAGHGDSN